MYYRIVSPLTYFRSITNGSSKVFDLEIKGLYIALHSAEVSSL